MDRRRVARPRRERGVLPRAARLGDPAGHAAGGTRALSGGDAGRAGRRGSGSVGSGSVGSGSVGSGSVGSGRSVDGAMEHLRRRRRRGRDVSQGHRRGRARGERARRRRAGGSHRDVRGPARTGVPAVAGRAASRGAAHQHARCVELLRPAHRRPRRGRTLLLRGLRLGLRGPRLRGDDPGAWLRRPSRRHHRSRHPRAAVGRRRTTRIRRRHRLDRRADRRDLAPVARGVHRRRPRQGGRAGRVARRHDPGDRTTPSGPTTSCSAIRTAPSSLPVSSIREVGELESVLVHQGMQTSRRFPGPIDLGKCGLAYIP